MRLLIVWAGEDIIRMLMLFSDCRSWRVLRWLRVRISDSGGELHAEDGVQVLIICFPLWRNRWANGKCCIAFCLDISDIEEAMKHL